MGTNPGRILQPKNISMYLAPVGTTAPVGLAAPAEDFIDVGLSNDESLKFRTGPEFAKVMAHQSNYPVAILQTTDAAGIDIDLLEWSAVNVKAAFGGGTITKTAGPPAYYTYVPPTFGNQVETAVLLDIFNGSKQYRFFVARARNMQGVELALDKKAEAKLALRLEILGGDGVDPWSLITNDTAFEEPEEA